MAVPRTLVPLSPDRLAAELPCRARHCSRWASLGAVPSSGGWALRLGFQGNGARVEESANMLQAWGWHSGVSRGRVGGQVLHGTHMVLVTSEYEMGRE